MCMCECVSFSTRKAKKNKINNIDFIFFEVKRFVGPQINAKYKYADGKHTQNTYKHCKKAARTS